MDLRKLKKLIDLVQESGIAELEVTEGEEKVKPKRAPEVGQHNEEVLTAAGYGAEEIKKLRSGGVIG